MENMIVEGTHTEYTKSGKMEGLTGSNTGTEGHVKHNINKRIRVLTVIQVSKHSE